MEAAIGDRTTVVELSPALAAYLARLVSRDLNDPTGSLLLDLDASEALSFSLFLNDIVPPAGVSARECDPLLTLAELAFAWRPLGEFLPTASIRA